ncbi:aldolase [Neobacillus sp. LXY-1]|uniref:aldolase n=1 Tax=Neobacillus sp. LXY-1 TaxID=3379133 RepID=UPI003EE3EAAE
MTITKSALLYKGFGLNLLSEIVLPEMTLLKHTVNEADIEIKKRDLSQRWYEIDSGTVKKFVVQGNEIMFEVPDTAIFSIQNGKEIIVSPIKGTEEDKIRLYILGTCMGAVLLQRKILPLHGSAIAIEGKAYAIVGHSGAGKSTLAAALMNKGYQLLSDDVIPISFDQNNVPYVTPSYPQQKLWQESLNQFGIESANLQPLFDRETKFAVPVHERFLEEKIPLEAIFELVINEQEKPHLKKIEGLEQLHTLNIHTYRNFLVTRLGMTEWHFKESAKILNHINMFQLQRPIGEFTASELMSLLLSNIK